GLAVLGVLVPFARLGLDLRGFVWPHSPGFEEWLEQLLERLMTPPSPDWAPARSWLLVLLGPAGCVLAYRGAGLFALLHQAEEAAEGAGRSDRPAFRVVSWRGFLAWGRRYFGRYFWLVNLFGAVLLAGFLPLLVGLWTVLVRLERPSGPLLAG